MNKYGMNQIEEMFADGLLCVIQDAMDDSNDAGLDVFNLLATYEIGECYNIETVEPQARVGIYRVDFLFTAETGQKFAVEIDGHETHKTKEQRYRDYQRERFLQEEGITVFRFMGSEIYLNARQCAKWVLETIERQSIKLGETIINHHEYGDAGGRIYILEKIKNWVDKKLLLENHRYTETQKTMRLMEQNGEMW